MNIVYCRTHVTPFVLAIGADVTLPATHFDGVEHTDCGVITVTDDPQLEAETAEQYRARIESDYEVQLV